MSRIDKLRTPASSHTAAWALAALAATLLAGCGVGGSGAGGNPFSGGGGGGGGSGTVTLTSFTATGTDGKTTSPASGNPVTIDGNQNGGNYQIAWNSTGTSIDGYTANLFFSVKPGDANVGNGDAVQITQLNCGIGEPACPANTGNFSCQFNESNMTVGCPVGNSQQGVLGEYTYIGQWLSNHGGLPGNYNLIMQLCTSSLNGSQVTSQCQTKTIPVSLN